MRANFEFASAEMDAKGDFAFVFLFLRLCSIWRKFHVLCLFFVGNMWNERFVL